MVNTVGKKLQQARLAQQLSIEEAARVTRIRPDKLLDLEEDNYSNFPSMSYAKGFLLLYARFLGVDVREFADTLHVSNPVSSGDYEYLSAAASGPQPPPSRRPYHFSPRRERTLLPVIVFAFLAAGIILAIYLVVTFQRIGNVDDLTDKKEPSSPAISTLPAPPVAVASQPAAVPAASPVPIARAIPVARAVSLPSATPALRNPPPMLAASPTPNPSPVAIATPLPAPPVLPPPAPASTFDPSKEVRRAEPVLPVGSGPAVSSIAPVTGGT